MKRVSILVPVYRVEKYIEQCARSLFEQSYARCEFIFVSDASPDRSVELLRSTVDQYPARAGEVKIIELAVNGGVAAARNVALDAASGEYILFVDADDWVDRFLVEKLVERAEATAADICNAWCVSVGEGIYERTPAPWIGGVREHLRAVLGQSHVVPNHIRGMLFRRELFESHGLRFTPRVDFGEDYSLLVQLLYYSSRLASCKEHLYFYRVENQNSYMNNIGSRQVDNYLAAQWIVTRFIASQVDAIDYCKALVRGRLNIKKWVFRRGLPAQKYDCEIFGQCDPRFESPLLRLYNFALNHSVKWLVMFCSVMLNGLLYAKWHLRSCLKL